jgi:hypothetical protein
MKRQTWEWTLTQPSTKLFTCLYKTLIENRNSNIIIIIIIINLET